MSPESQPEILPPEPAPAVAPAPPPVPRGSSRGRATLITASSQLAAPLASAILGIYIAREFRTGPSTDAFFFANAVYGIVLFVGSSLRMTTVTGLMVDGRLDRSRFLAYLRAVGIMAVAAVIVFALLGAVVVPAFLPHAARGTAQACLLILLPAALLQLVGGLLAAALATNDDFSTAAVAYIGAAVGTVIAAVALRGAFGVEAVPTAMVLGALCSTSVMARGLLRHQRGGALTGSSAVHASSVTLFLRITMGAAATIAPQIIVSVSVIFAAHGGSGDSTIMSYGQTAIVMLTTLLATPLMTVYAPVVAREHRHDVRSLLELSDRAFRAGAVITPLAVAALCLLGPAPAHALLTRMDHQQVTELFRTALIISPCLLLSQALVIPMLGVVTSERFVARAAATLAVAALHVVLCALVIIVTPHVLTGLALTMVISTIGLTLVDFRLAFGSLALRALARTVAAAVSIDAVGAALYAVAALLLKPAGRFPAGLLVFAIGSLVYAAWLIVRHRGELHDLVGSLGLQRA